MRVLPIYLGHVLHTRTLPNHHLYPFDRILVSQAILEEMPLLSADSQLSRYPAEVLW